MTLLLSILFALCFNIVGTSDDDVKTLAREAGVPGMQIIFARDGKVQSACIGDDINNETVFQAASLSKVVFSYIVMRLHDRGLIDLDKSLMDYYYNTRFEDPAMARKITARMVLKHRTGLPNWAVGPSSDEWPDSRLNFKYPVDEGFAYSGEGFAYLQQCVEKITGKDLNTLAKEEVFEPLGMKNSSYTWREDFDSHHTDGHQANGDVSPIFQYSRANAAYTLLTTAGDYYNFLNALMRGKGLKKKTKEMMLHFDGPCVRNDTTVITRACRSVSWGLGIGLGNNIGRTIAWHWGDNGTFKAFFAMIPDSKEIVVFFTNSRNGLKLIVPVLNLYMKKDKTLWENIPLWLDQHYGD